MLVNMEKRLDICFHVWRSIQGVCGETSFITAVCQGQRPCSTCSRIIRVISWSNYPVWLDGKRQKRPWKLIFEKITLFGQQFHVIHISIWSMYIYILYMYRQIPKIYNARRFHFSVCGMFRINNSALRYFSMVLFCIVLFFGIALKTHCSNFALGATHPMFKFAIGATPGDLMIISWGEVCPKVDLLLRKTVKISGSLRKVVPNDLDRHLGQDEAAVPDC